jgi:p-cumate 2,3-dioxygenase subunit beta
VQDIGTEQRGLRQRVEEFLYREAALLDATAYDEWFELFDEGASYAVPSTDVPDGAEGEVLFLINDNYERLKGRVTRLMSRDAHADYPHPRTRRLVTNVRVSDAGEDDLLEVRANFLVYSLRVGNVFQFVGEYRYLLREEGDGFKIRHRRARLDLETLDYGGGKINIVV